MTFLCLKPPFVYSGSVKTPSAEMMCPKNFPSRLPSSHFNMFSFSVFPFCSRTACTSVSCYFFVAPQMRMLPMWQMMPSRLAVTSYANLFWKCSARRRLVPVSMPKLFSASGQINFSLHTDWFNGVLSTQIFTLAFFLCRSYHHTTTLLRCCLKATDDTQTPSSQTPASPCP